jgi:predicted CXXCH cytochrome family protein
VGPAFGMGGAFRLSTIKAALARFVRSHVSWTAGVASLALLAVPVTSHALDSGDPLPWGSKPVSSHAPYVAHDCVGCHTKKWGGPLIEVGDNVCLPCHEDAKRHVHAPRNCIRCHNAHDSLRKKLLRADLDKCAECHQKR